MNTTTNHQRVWFDTTYIIVEIKQYKKLISIYLFILCHRVHHRMSATATVIAPESVAVHLERNPTPEEEYWPLTFVAVRDCDLSYLNDKWSEDMIRDGMRAILRANEDTSIKTREINVWKYLSQYSPPDGRGFMFSAGDDRIVSQVQSHMETGHSGGSMGWTMRQIEFIAKNGLPAHRKLFLENRRQ